MLKGVARREFDFLWQRRRSGYRKGFTRKGIGTQSASIPRLTAATRAGAAGNTLAVGMCRKKAQTKAEISPSNASP